MIPYSNFLYFYIITLAAIPAIILGLLEKRIKWYGTVATFVMILIIFGSTPKQMVYLIGFYLIETIIVFGYFKIVKSFKQRWGLWIAVFLAILPLVCTKLGGELGFGQIGFLGISYLTFKAVQMTIQIYDGSIKKINFWDFTYFLLFFPTISSGPIDRSKRFIDEANKGLNRKEYIELLGDGLWKVIMGIGYKFIIGYYVNENWIKHIPETNHSFFNTLKYMYAYSFYLFFDFAGYSLIAVGVSYILGVKTPNNFNLPFISKDIKDFWNRWHMSLSFWFRDFVYNRFVMASIKKRWFKSKYTASYIGYGITMGLMGVWHGLEPHYIIYGLYHGGLIVVTDIFQRGKFYQKVRDKSYWNGVSTFITFNLVCFGFLIFSGYLFK